MNECIHAFVYGDTKAGPEGKNYGLVEMKEIFITVNLDKIILFHAPEAKRLELDPIEEESDSSVKAHLTINEESELTENNVPIHRVYPTEYSMVIDGVKASNPFVLYGDEYKRLNDLMKTNR